MPLLHDVPDEIVQIVRTSTDRGKGKDNQR
jgi:hypothetical protein